MDHVAEVCCGMVLTKMDPGYKYSGAKRTVGLALWGPVRLVGCRFCRRGQSEYHRLLEED
jgi:hypothetical protein